MITGKDQDYRDACVECVTDLANLSSIKNLREMYSDKSCLGWMDVYRWWLMEGNMQKEEIISILETLLFTLECYETDN